MQTRQIVQTLGELTVFTKIFENYMITPELSWAGETGVGWGDNSAGRVVSSGQDFLMYYISILFKKVWLASDPGQLTACLESRIFEISGFKAQIYVTKAE